MTEKTNQNFCECCGQKIPKEPLSPALIREFLNYDAEKGTLTWKKRDRKHFKNDRAYAVFNSRYPDVELIGTDKTNQVYLLGRSYKIHRLIWCHVYGEWPEKNLVIDHINGDGKDNRIQNLRLVTQSENNKNSSRPKSNTSGVIGVSKRRDNGKWIAQIQGNYKKIFLGSFDNLEDAIAARKEAEIKYGFHENHGRETDG
jgi:hypothetical protein